MKINWVEIVVGVLACMYGLYTIYVRIKSPEKMGKIDALKRFWGNIAGTIIHVIFYTIIPLVFGLLLIVSGILGKRLF